MAASHDADPVQELTARYDRAAEVYRDLWAPVLLEGARGLLRELPDARVERVIDVGCGVGALLPELERRFEGARIHGLDRSRGMLALAPARFGRVQLDARRLAVRSGCADVVLMLFMLFHLDDPLAGLREARRVLRSGRRIGTLTWAGEIESPAMSIWSECLDAHGAIPADPAAEARHEAVDSPAKMEALLGQAGFREPRTWEGEVAGRFDTERLIHLRTNLGSSKPRFDSLGPGAATACVTEARRRMASLGPEAFVARAPVVYAIARG